MLVAIVAPPRLVQRRAPLLATTLLRTKSQRLAAKPAAKPAANLAAKLVAKLEANLMLQPLDPPLQRTSKQRQISTILCQIHIATAFLLGTHFFLIFTHVLPFRIKTHDVHYYLFAFFYLLPFQMDYLHRTKMIALVAK